MVKNKTDTTTIVAAMVVIAGTLPLINFIGIFER
jgi:hypothetical protein